MLKPTDISGNTPPGPKSYLPFGTFLQLSKDPMGFLTSCSRKYGDIVYLPFLHLPICLFSNPADIEHVLLKNPSNFEKTPDYHAMRKIMGNGLLVAEKEQWQKNRKMLQPAFRHDSVFAHAELMTRLTEERVKTWQNGQVLDIHQQLMTLTLDIVGRALLGSNLSSRAADVGSALDTLMKQFMHQAKLAFLFPNKFPMRTPSFKRAARQIDEIVCSAIEQRRLARGKSNDLLEMLLACQDAEQSNLSDKQLRDEVITLFLTGHETTANALSWAWYLLAQHPEVEAALHQELDTVLDGRTPTAKDLGRLPYTEMVMKEALRLYPATWAIGRRAIGPFETGGYTFPAGTIVVLLQWSTHHDRRFFPEPERFYPGRWTIDSLHRNPIPRFAYFPFGGGPRVCIGAGFAMMEATLVLATIAQRFRLTLVPDQEVTPMPSVTLRPKNGIRMLVHERQHAQSQPAEDYCYAS